MRTFYILSVFVSAIFAQGVETLFAKLPKTPLYKKMVQKVDAEFLNARAETFNENYRISLSGAYARPDDGGSGGEYEIGFGRDLFFRKSLLENYFGSLEEISKDVKRVELARLKVRVWRLYGNYCIKMQALQAKGGLGVVYDEIARHIDKGVRLGEFSASDAIMAHLALDTLNLQISELESEVAELEASLRSIVAEFDGQYECTGLKPDTDRLFYPKNSYLWDLLHKNLASLKTKIKLQRALRDLSLDLSFSDEIDTKRGIVALSIPLYKGSANEAKRAAIAKEISAAIFDLQATQQSWAQESRALKQRLEIYLEHVSKTEESIKLSANTLIEQSRMRFRAGEESLFSMLKAIETKLNLIETILDLKLRRHNAVADYMQKYAVDIERILK